ncbi:hypothetical protein [Planococcus glaciei]|uniref:hypothetical protein n=1 Tax=Planococcus glaciei TaxID=459472 RepID=UPI0011131F9D|nr:hypothetical protein [Planococcus glaciei]
MGTSKRNIEKKVKELLEGKPYQELNVSAPELSKKILTKKELISQLADEDTIQESFITIKNSFLNLSGIGYKGKTKKEVLEDPLTQEEFINMILNEIENEEFLNKSILEKAYKIAMIKMLKKDDFDIYAFAHILFFHLIHQILLKQLYDTLKEVYEDLPYEKINNLILNLTNQIINDTIYDLVNNFVDKKLPLNSVLDRIIIETQNASFGEF